MSVARRTWYQLKWLRVFRSVVVTGIDSLFPAGYGSAMTELLLDKISGCALLRFGRCCFEKIEESGGGDLYPPPAVTLIWTAASADFENRFRINRDVLP